MRTETLTRSANVIDLTRSYSRVQPALPMSRRGEGSLFTMEERESYRTLDDNSLAKIFQESNLQLQTSDPQDEGHALICQRRILTTSVLVDRHRDLIARHVGAIHRKIGKSSRLNDDREDMRVIGVEAFLRLVGKFDPKKGELTRYIAKNLQNRIIDIVREEDECARRVSDPEVRMASGYVWPISLEEPIFNESDHENNFILLIKDGLADGLGDDPVFDEVWDSRFVGPELMRFIRRALSLPELTDRELEVFEKRYSSGETRTFDAIGKDYDVTGSRVCQNHAESIRKIRRRITKDPKLREQVESLK